MNDEWTFGRDKSMVYNSNGDFWAEGGVFEPNNICAASTPANMTGPGGTDLSAFGDGNHTFVLTNGTKPTLEVVGLGAFIGLQKIGTDLEVSVPQNSVKYDIIKLSDGATDTLILEVGYKWDPMNTSDNAYWRITLVHYDNPADEPAVASFKADVAGKVAAFTNNSFEGESYIWNFGDGATSTETSPTHTYAAGGIFTVTLQVKKGNTTSTVSKDITVSGDVTEADLIGGAWKVRNAANSIFVGPGLGNSTWWQVPANYLDGTSTGADDWSCITNDEFIFSSGGVYEYKTNGDARNDGYMGSPNGCWSDAQVAASGNGAAFGSAVHSFAFTPASGSDRPVITLTNGPSGAAFIGFYKGYYGGENGTSTNAPNGGNTTNRYEVMSYVKENGQETLTVSVDISSAKDGSSAWTMVLVR
ncbi:MAG: PKD domain-containing protein [Chitinophagales bacterium]|nr:PKD domain-containing protein [Chitinophagales bacterium]